MCDFGKKVLFSATEPCPDCSQYANYFIHELAKFMAELRFGFLTEPEGPETTVSLTSSPRTLDTVHPRRAPAF